MTAKTSTNTNRLDRLERTVYSLNGEPGLVEQVRDLARVVNTHTRLLWVAVLFSAATFFGVDVPVREVVVYISKLLVH